MTSFSGNDFFLKLPVKRSRSLSVEKSGPKVFWTTATYFARLDERVLELSSVTVPRADVVLGCSVAVGLCPLNLDHFILQ